MEPRAVVHARHQSYHSHTTRFSSPLEDQNQTTTLSEQATTIELAKRSTSSNTSSLTSGINPTIPIVVGICVPLAVIIVTFIWLHRRHVRRARAEERADPHKSLDFGLGNKPGTSRNAKEMAATDFEKSLRNGRGLSMDILGSPYLLPPELHNSRESLNSLSRNVVHEAHDPYRPVNTFLSSTSDPARESFARDDAASIRSGSTLQRQRTEGISSPLVPNAQRMPFSSTSTLQSIGEMSKPNSRAQPRSPLASVTTEDGQHSTSQFMPPPPRAHIQEDRADHFSVNGSQASQYQREQVPTAHTQSFHIPQQPKNPQSLPTMVYSESAPIPQIQFPNDEYEDDYYDESHYIQPPSMQHSDPASPYSASSDRFYTPTEEHQGFQYPTSDMQSDGLGVANVPFDSRRASVLRPLPPDDPSDTPQQRAIRIRSFYKEYFNDQEGRVQQQVGNEYYEDYGQEYVGGNAPNNSHTGQYFPNNAPFAEPVTRRAMTPPPRGTPRFSDHHNRAGSSPGGQPRARAFSTASVGGIRGPAPRRQAPPPAALRTLPTPHLLREDAFALPIDFAPPTRIRDQAAGRSASPKMERRPFSPQVAIANPLASSFNELPVMPSPHALRSSGTFTALDFAPPPRFRDRDNASDAGSIRSGRSTHSTSSRMQVQNIRAGTYRVSRIPKELVGTQNEFSDILKPTWKVGS